MAEYFTKATRLREAQAIIEKFFPDCHNKDKMVNFLHREIQDTLRLFNN